VVQPGPVKNVISYAIQIHAASIAFMYDAWIASVDGTSEWAITWEMFFLLHENCMTSYIDFLADSA